MEGVREDIIDDDVLGEMEKERGLNLTREGVIGKLQDQDRYVTNVRITFAAVNDEDNDRHFWEAAGRAIGRSHFLKTFTMVARDSFRDNNHEMVLSLCRGVALNRSIASLEICLDYRFDANRDRNAENEAIFQVLVPFFQENKNLSELSIRYDGCISTAPIMRKVLSSCRSLQEIRLDKSGPKVVQAEEELFRDIITICTLSRLTISGNLFGGSGAEDLKSVLADPQCMLKYLKLGQQCLDLHDFSAISTGLARNTSIEHIQYYGEEPLRLLNFNELNYSLERLDLGQNDEGHDDNIDVKFAAELSKLRSLKSLNLGRRPVKTETFNAIINAVLTPTSKIEELSIYNGRRLKDDSLRVLSTCMAANVTLKALTLQCTDVSQNGWRSFFIALHDANLSLERIDLSRNCVDDTVLPDFLRLLNSCGSLKYFDLNDCRISSHGWLGLLSSINRQTSIESLRVLTYKAFNYEFPAELRELLEGGQLKKLVIGSSVTPDLVPFQMTLSVLDNPNCCLEELSFCCDFNSQEELLQTTTEWTQSLSANFTLKKLYIKCFFYQLHSVAGVWEKYSNLLCNKDTIESTFASNHSLQWLGIEFVEDNESNMDDNEGGIGLLREIPAQNMPFEVSSFLQINRNPDKMEVARRKIILAHFSGSSSDNLQKMQDLNIPMKEMPHLVCWIGKEQSDLTLMYDFIRSTPALVQGKIVDCSSRKRKKTD